MLSAADLPLYLVAIKSLMRFHSGFGVVIHSDRTLRSHHVDLLTHHIPGCRIVDAHEADMRAERMLSGNDFMLKWRGLDASWRRVIDTELWSRSERRIIMDADVLFMREPSEVVEWTTRGMQPFLIGQPPKESGEAVGPLGKRQIQTVFKERLDALASKLEWMRSFQDGTTSGFYGTLTELPLSRIEKVLRAAIDVGIPMHEWGGEQCTVIYLLSISNPLRLNEHRYFNFLRDYADRLRQASMAHFLGTDRFYKNLYTNLASAVVSSLPRS